MDKVDRAFNAIPIHDDNCGSTCRNSGLQMTRRNAMHDSCGVCHALEDLQGEYDVVLTRKNTDEALV